MIKQCEIKQLILVPLCTKWYGFTGEIDMRVHAVGFTEEMTLKLRRVARNRVSGCTNIWNG